LVGEADEESIKATVTIMENIVNILPRRTIPTKENRYIRSERPLSYQPRFTPVATQPINNYGYPEPGIQSPTARQVIAEDFLISEETWEDICNTGDVDFIVIGSGFTALAFIDQTLKQDPTKKIICLERGDFWLLDHFQNLPLPFKYTLGGPSETFPFSLSRYTYDSTIKFVHGSTPFFGGRSTFWSAWSPTPTPDLMREWPDSMKKTAGNPDSEFFNRARSLLRVTSASDIGPPYANLQAEVSQRVEQVVPGKKIPTATDAFPAPMAVGPIAQSTTIRFTKFSTPGALLALYEQQQKRQKEGTGSALLLATEKAVQYLITDLGYPPPPPNLDEDVSVKFVRSDRTTDLPVRPHTKIILCAGAFPNATLLLNSFSKSHVPTIEGVGKTVTGHFLSHVVGRVHRSAFKNLNPESLEIAAEYVAGIASNKLQYHIQVTAIASPDPNQDAEDAARFCPDYAAAASQEQLRGSEHYVIFVCATLGELSENNHNSWFRKRDTGVSNDPTANCVLQVLLNKDDNLLWNEMDQATFELIGVMAGEGPGIDWWHQPQPKDGQELPPGVWKKELPGRDTIRMPGIVHEASLAPLGNSNDCPVDENYKVKGVSNVYVTGAALFPTSGSWNPTMTMCGFAQDLAIKLTAKAN
jgi:choline dehydrogenase-like flavoprotein